MKTVPLFKTYLPKNTIRRVEEVIQSGWVGCGPETEKFEREFGKKYGQPYCVATNACTSALHLAYVLAGVGPGDEVICPLFTCTATNIPILYCGATPVFADIDPTTFNVDPEDIERRITKKTRAISVVHWGGYAADMDAIRRIARKHKLPVIVDAAHALGAKYHGKDISHYGDYICYSFQAIKQITTVEGGMLVVKTPEDYRKANILRWYGIDRLADRDTPKRYEEFTDLGWRYIPNDVFMAIGRIQLKENLAGVTKHRRRIADIYRRRLSGHPNLLMLENAPTRFSTYWLFTLLCDDRPKFRALLAKHGFATGMAHFRNDISPVFGSKRLRRPGMDLVEDKYVCIPMHMGVTEDDAERLCEVLWDHYFGSETK